MLSGILLFVELVLAIAFGVFGGLLMMMMETVKAASRSLEDISWRIGNWLRR